MADHVIFADTRWDPKRKTQPGKLFFLILGVVLVVLAGEGLFQFVLAPNLRIRKISLEESLGLERQEVLKLAGLEGPLFYFLVKPDTIRRNLEAVPGIKRAYVEKSFPDALNIRILSRTPLAAAMAETPEGIVPLVFDDEGVIFLAGENVADLSLPVVSGIKFEGVKPGVKLPPMLGAFLKELRDLRDSHPALFDCFSEYKIVNKGEGNFEVLLYPMHHRVPVRIEPAFSTEQAKMILMVLDVMDKEHLLDKVEEIDFRTGDIVYRLKGE